MLIYSLLGFCTSQGDIGPGCTDVVNLSTFLASLREQEAGLSSEQADTVIQLWESLSDYDKSRTSFPHRFSAAGSGRLRSPKKQVALLVVSIER